jgi:hypothetical protein
MFSVVDAVLLNSVALRGLRDPGRLVVVWEKNPSMMMVLGGFAGLALLLASLGPTRGRHPET